ncbi:CaiB/BaiF CoA-transferase family protein [Devosia ginsengisoli]|uniref:CaiB/BaiF CoA transferase family protein n=1 Tax=Devosia ginsengisoli TaxID=400770 RepID=UPI0026E9B7AE|nr:CoA transferase [Devosia ginsengisoli]MCR6672602.1 CoA transferase [Devosia ginsengisoli]
MQGLAALDGIRIVCFGMGAAAPFATASLADFGAEVIKVEPPTGDWSRTTPGLGTREFNRNKQGIAINLKSSDGLALARKLIARADVVMESFRPGVMDRLGLGYATLKQAHPRLVYCSVSAYGQDGPWKDKPGVDGIIQAVSGIMSVFGSEDEDAEPIKTPFPLADMAAGFLAAQGILLALLAREKHGMGQHVDVSLLEAALVIQKSSMTRYLQSGVLPRRTGSRAPYATPNEAYRTSDGHIMLAAYSPTRWSAFCRNVLGLPELETDPRFVDRKVRQGNQKALKHIIEEVLSRRTSAEWLQLCEANDLICGPINTYDQVVAHAQVRARNAIETVSFPDGETMRTLAATPKLSVTPGKVTSPYPAEIGQHTRQVLAELGLAPAEIDRLRDKGAIGAA